MNNLNGLQHILDLQKKWNIKLLFLHILRSVAYTVLVLTVLSRFVSVEYVLLAVLLLLIVAFVTTNKTKKISSTDVVQFLNETHPDLEESAQLLLKPAGNLNTLEKLQLIRVNTRLASKLVTPASITKKLRTALILLAFALITGITILNVPVTSFEFNTPARKPPVETNAAPGETKPVGIAGVTIKISPPTYTHKPLREQQKFNIVAEQDADLTWTISTASPVQHLQLLFNDRSVLNLLPKDKNRAIWFGSKVVKSSGFYQVKTGNSLSELYQVEMTRDRPPLINVRSPKTNTLVEYGSPQKIAVTVSLTDDYGVETAVINATIASGSGEAVKFKEQQFSFPGFQPGGQVYLLQKQLDLPSLGMEPGDELYLYVTAKDSYQQERRSDVYIVRLEDTTQLMNMDGLLSGTDIKPEFFRSERQIIIETEQLLKDRDTISIESFNKKSADLGIDQKLLRLRYGKFLGEKSDAEGEETDQMQTGVNTGTFGGNGAQILDQYSHKHDNAEDATYFDAGTKKQLLATLSEMWKAELQLRTLQARAALPFEYKALRLLKVLQQQTRAYVAKAGSKTTPLKPESQLTGELGKITEPVVEQNFRQPADPSATLQKALGILEQVRSREALQKTSIEILQSAGSQLSTRAVSQPGIYLASLQALRRIISGKFIPTDINLAGSALQKIIGETSNFPQRTKSAPDMNLSQRYFFNLSRKND